MNVSISGSGAVAHTTITLNQLELLAITDMLCVAAEQTSGRLSHDLAGFADAIAEPMKKAVSDAMEGIVGKYDESEVFIVPVEMQGKIDSIMDKLFRSAHEKVDDANPPENVSKASKRRVLPDDN